MDEELKKFAAAIRDGVGAITGPSPDSITSNYLTSSARKGLSESSVGGLGQIAGTQADIIAKQEEQARQAKIDSLKDQLDPSKYQKVRKADGGFDFLDPSGQKIDINTYAQRTGERRADILKDSENPIDQQYVNDFVNANDLMQAVYNGDKQTVSDIVAQNPDLKDKKPEDYLKELILKYPHLYGRGNYADTQKNFLHPAFKSDPNFLGSGGGGFQL